MRCLVTAHDTHEGGPVPPQRPSLRQKNRSPQLFCKRLPCYTSILYRRTSNPDQIVQLTIVVLVWSHLSDLSDFPAPPHKLPHGIAAIGLEAGPLSHWLHKGLSDAGFETVLMETRQVKAALKAMPIKTDRRDAEGIARLLQMGWFRPVHCKSVSSQEMRALLTSRKSVQDALTNLELSLRGVLRNFDLKLSQVSKGRYEARVRELTTGNAMLEAAAEPILRVRADLRRELAGLEKLVRNLARQDRACRLLMTMPGVGAVIALTFTSAIDDPERFRRSKDVGPWVGLTPRRGPIRRTGYCRPDHEGRRYWSARGALPSRHGDAEPRGAELAEGLGAASDEAPRQEARNRCPGTADRRGASSHCGGTAPSSASRVRRRWRFGRHSRSGIPSVDSEDRRKGSRPEMAGPPVSPSPGRGSR